MNSTIASPLPSYRAAGPPSSAIWARVAGVEYLVPQASPLAFQIAAKRPWRAGLCAAILDATNPASGFLELGAGFGYFSALIAKSRPACRVQAIEDDPTLLRFAAANLVHFPNASLFAGRVSSKANGSNDGHAASPYSSLIELIKEHRPEVVRIDTIGHEDVVLKSLDVRNLLQHNLSIFATLRPRFWTDGGARFRGVIAEIESCGFSAFFMHEGHTMLAYTSDRLKIAEESLTSWDDHLDLLIVRGRHLDILRAG